MQITRKEENKETIYDIEYDEEAMKTLIANIINNCSIRRKRRCCIEARSLEEAQNTILNAESWCGNKIYENAKDFHQEPVNDPFDYWRHGDPVPFSFTSNKLLIPQLANFLVNILNGEKIDYEWFASRKELTQKDEVQAEIASLDSQINQTSNFDTERKISMLQKLAAKKSYSDQIPDFDYELLERYYNVATNCINLSPVQTTITYKKTPKATPANQ